MTNRRAMELLAIERACVRRASGLEPIENVFCESGYSYRSGNEGCNRNCSECGLVQDTGELLEMYDFVIRKMITETAKEEQEDEYWREWQIQADKAKYGVLTI